MQAFISLFLSAVTRGRARFDSRGAALLALSFCACSLVRAQTTLLLPAFTAYAEPNPEALEIHETGPIAGWQDSATHLAWYGQIRSTGRLGLALRVLLPSGEQARFQMKIGETSYPAVSVTGTGKVETVALGSINLERADPIQVLLFGVSRSGATFGQVEGLELSGPACEGALFNLTSQRGAPSVHLNYPLPAGVDAEWFYDEVTVKTDPIWSYYEATGFARGYFGIQVNSATERRIIFSVWDSGKEAEDRSKVAAADRVQLLAKGDGVFASDFGNEGTGGHSHLVYPWKTGDTYRFLVHAQVEGDATVYSGYFFFPEKKAWGLIARFRAPKDGHWLTHLYSFNEDFEGANGQRERRAEFGNQWIRTRQGEWMELRDARFTHTARGQFKDRIDRAAGVDGDRFFLTGGGFAPSTMQYDDPLTRPTSGRRPEIVLPKDAGQSQ